jgi:hypothetical protein
MKLKKEINFKKRNQGKNKKIKNKGLIWHKNQMKSNYKGWSLKTT